MPDNFNEFFLCYIKLLVYADKPMIKHALDANIPRFIEEIRPELPEQVVQNWSDRILLFMGDIFRKLFLNIVIK